MSGDNASGTAKLLVSAQPTAYPCVENPSAPARIRELDSLRGLAAVAVALFHLASWDYVKQVAIRPMIWGHFGVELFFIISGFVIFMTLARSRSVYEFGVSRVARLFPAYWAAIAVTTVVAHWSSPGWDASPPGPGQVAMNLTMLQRFFRVTEVDGSYWTLAIELSFYVAIAAIARIGLKGNIERVCIAWLVCAAAIRIGLVLAGRRGNLDPFGSITGLYYGQFFIIGMMIYRITRGEMSRLTIPIVIASGAMSLFGGGPLSLYAGPLPYFCITVGLGACVLLATSGRLAFLRWAPLVILGEMSYPLYLVHDRIGIDLMRITRARGAYPWAQSTLALTLAAVLAFAIHRCVEVPGRAYIRTALARVTPR
jgi:peptidoglycan/LPS O-acetylase OafA/YrhL